MTTRKPGVPLLPGYSINHPMPVKGEERRAKPQKLCYFKNTMYDFPIPQHEPEYNAEEAKELCSTMEKADWRYL